MAAHPTAETALQWTIVICGVFFLFPANLFLYGTNDIHDEETDAKNPKKRTYEATVTATDHHQLRRTILASITPFIVLVPFIPSIATLALAAFLLFGIAYSAPPVRAKARPFLDSLSNGLYIFPGIAGYALADGTAWSPIGIGAAWLWCMAMHAYSAVPDITADRSVGIATIATTLGAKKTLLVCAVLYALSALGLALTTWWPTIVLAIPYLSLIAASYRRDERGIFELYTYFPFLNMATGACIFLMLLAQSVL